MRRYRGEDLPEGCRIAVIANDALGNYVVTTPLLQMLRAKHRPHSLDYYSGVRTEELWRKDPNIGWGFPLFGSRPEDAVRSANGPYDLVVNIEASSWAKSFCSLISGKTTLVCGPCLALRTDGETCPTRTIVWDGLPHDPDWTTEDLSRRYDCLESGFMGEILCRMAYLEGPIPHYSVPHEVAPFDIPAVLVSTSASLPAKLWPTNAWLEAVRWLHSYGLTIGLLGAKPAEQRRYWFGDSTEEAILSEGLAIDLRGELSLPQVVGALSQARLCFTIDNGVLHLGAAVRTPTVGIFREGIHRLWAPPVNSLRVLTPEKGCEVSQIETSAVIAALDEVLSASGD